MNNSIKSSMQNFAVDKALKYIEGKPRRKYTKTYEVGR